MANDMYNILLNKILKCRYKHVKSGIYIIKCINNSKIYIGSTSNFERRFETHKLSLKYNNHPNYRLQDDFNKFGIDCFTFEKHKEYAAKYDRSKLYDIEQIEINNLKPQYNIQLKVYNPILKKKKKNKKSKSKIKGCKNLPKKKSNPFKEYEKRKRVSAKALKFRELNVRNEAINTKWKERVKR